MEIDSNNGTFAIYGHSVKRNRQLMKKNTFMSFLNATNRFVVVNKVKMPIYTDTDETLGFLNIFFTDGIFYIKFYYNNRIGCSILESEFYY